MRVVRSIALEKLLFLPATRVTDDVSVLTLKSLVLEPLLNWNRGRYAPGLFDRWSGSNGGRSWEFRIREGAIFHDGTPCRAEHVLSFIEDVLGSTDMFGMKWAYARYFASTRFTAGPHNSVRVEDPQPIAHVQDIFCEFYLSRPDPAGAPTIGTGPWRVCAHDPEHVELQRIGGEDWLLLTALRDAERRLDAVLTGQVDVAMNLERADQPLARNPDGSWLSVVSTMSVTGYLNCLRPPFSDERARQAVNVAVDVQALVREVYHELAEPASTVVSPAHLGMGEPPPRLAHDRDKARRLMDELGGPAEIVLRTPTFMPEKAPAMAAVIASDLERIGWTVTVDVEEDRPHYARQIGQRQMGDIAIFDSSPHSTFRILSDKVSSRVQGTWWQGYDDAKAERLIAKAFAAHDDRVREVTYREALRYLAATPPWLYLVHPVLLAGIAPGAGGFHLDSRGVLGVV